MDLRAIRQEVRQLPALNDVLLQFRQHWIKPLRSNTNSHLPVLQNLPDTVRKDINRRLQQLQPTFKSIEERSFLTQKLNSYARHLVDLKLTSIQGNFVKARLITNALIQDELLNIKDAIREMKELEESVQQLTQSYQQINEEIQRHLTLDQAVVFFDLPHKYALQKLRNLTEKKKTLLQQIGKQFISLTREVRVRRKQNGI